MAMKSTIKGCWIYLRQESESSPGGKVLVLKEFALKRMGIHLEIIK
jgi:hypothetical protein